MRHLRITVLVIFATSLGCGGRQPAQGPKPAHKGSPSPNANPSDSGVPGWVQQGSAALTSGKGRVFYGVGTATDIKNPSLLRSTADNRARDELAKVLQVFSASLMKDYSASSGEQQIEQAVKTVSSSALKGVEIVDRYMGADGAFYSLAALDLDTAMAKVRAAESSGAVKSHVAQVNVDDIFDAHANKPAPPPPPLKVAGSTSSKPAPKAATSSAKTRTGERPPWVDGYDPRFPADRYLCAVGYGPERAIAESGGYAALARVFVSRVESVSRDFMGAYSKTGSPFLEVQTTEALTQISTGKIFSGVQILEVWADSSGTTFSLACLERDRAGQVLREQIAGAEERAGKYLGKAKSADRAQRLKELGRALDALVEREALNGELRIVDANGVGVQGAYSLVDVAGALKSAVEALRVGVQAQGPYAGDFRSALVEALTKRGYQVSELNDRQESELDVLVSASIRMEDGGKGAGSAAKLHFARGVVQVEVKNVAQARVTASLNEQRKEGHRSKEEAERRVVRKLGKKISNKLGAKIDEAMKGQ